MEGLTRLGPESPWKRGLLILGKTAGYFLLSVIIAFPLFLLFGTLAVDGESAAAMQSSDLGQVNPWVLVGIWLILLSGAVVAAIIFRRFIDKQPVMTVGWGPESAPADFGRGALLGIVFISLGFLVLWVFRFSAVTSGEFSMPLLIAWVIFFLVQTTYEEIVFRGYLLRMTAEYAGPVAALVVTSLLFGIVHGANENFNLIGLLNIILAGLVLGVLVLRTGNIWAASGLHFTWNLFQSVIYGFPVSGMTTYRLLKTETSGPELLTGGGFGLEGSILMVLLLGAYLWWQRGVVLKDGRKEAV